MKCTALRRLAIFIICASSFSINAQAQKDLIGRCQNPVPEMFRTAPQDKILEDISQLGKQDSRFDKKAKERFILESSFRLEKLYKSGYVIFNDPTSIYVSEVAKVLLKNKPELYSKLKFFTVQLSEANSFCTNDGSVFVTTGLMAQLENEAQLAAVLAHEIIHFTKQHVIESYVHDERVAEGKDNYRTYNNDERESAIIHYSKAFESQADSLGYLEFFKESAYSKSAAARVFEVLLYSSLPIDEITFDNSFFELKNCKFPETYKLKKLNPIKTVEDYDDSKHTHPNIKKRRTMMIGLIDKEESGKEYIVSKERFAELHYAAQHDLGRLYIEEMDVAASLYNSYVLLKRNPNDSLVEADLAIALYYLYKHRAHGSSSAIVRSYSDIEGESQQLYYLMDRIKQNELIQLAFVRLRKAALKLPNDLLLNDMLLDLASELFADKANGVDELMSAITKDAEPPMPDLTPEEEAKMNKVEKIEYYRKRNKSNKTGGTSYIGLCELNGDAGIEPLLKRAKNQADSIAKVKEKPVKQNKKEAKRIERYGAFLGIKDIIVFDPVYYKVDERKKTEIRFLDSEESRSEYVSLHKEFVSQLGINGEIFDYNMLASNDAARFNDYSLIRRWRDMQSDLKEMPMVNLYSQRMKDLCKKYGKDYIATSIAIDYCRKKNNVAGRIFLTLGLSLYFPPILPFGLYAAVKPSYISYYQVHLENGTTGKPVFGVVSQQNTREAKDLRNSFLYDALNQIQRDKTTK